jgi:hypothetical protein
MRAAAKLQSCWVVNHADGRWVGLCELAARRRYWAPITCGQAHLRTLPRTYIASQPHATPRDGTSAALPAALQQVRQGAGRRKGSRRGQLARGACDTGKRPAVKAAGAKRKAARKAAKAERVAARPSPGPSASSPSSPSPPPPPRSSWRRGPRLTRSGWPSTTARRTWRRRPTRALRGAAPYIQGPAGRCPLYI